MATGTPTRIPAPAFHADDLEQTSSYRTLSVLAIISLIFGLASPLCFGGPLLMAIPIVGVAVSILALRRIELNSSILAGRWLAVCGLILCVACATAAPSRDFVLRTIRTHQAKDFGERWITMLLNGQTEHAFRLTSDATHRPPPPEPGMPPQKPAYEVFTEQPTVKSLASAGANAEVRFDDTVECRLQSYWQVVARQKFAILPSSTPKSAASPSQPFEVVLMMQRAQLPGEARARWLVTNADTAQGSAGSSPPP